MHQVGHHLQIEAMKAAAADRDAFARSAYNRYYYSAFLLARDMIKRIFPERVRNLGHADYPNFLEGTVVKELKSARKRAQKSGDVELVDILRRAEAAAFSLASQFELSNTIRITADYDPETLVVFVPAKRFLLKQVDVTQAHNWAQNTQSYVAVIEGAWKHLNV